MNARIVRPAQLSRSPVTIRVDGEPIMALAGDTILEAVLNGKGYWRDARFDACHRPRPCLIGPCPDCLVWTIEGEKLQACTTLVSEGLSVVTVLSEAARWRPD
jgi:predicted molibdopterin-dependent oxidoreductase YjgC